MRLTRPKFLGLNESSGLTLIESILSVAAVGIIITTSMSLLSNYFEGTSAAKQFGDIERIRTYLRRSVSCEETLRRERSKCENNQPLDLYRKNGTKISDQTGKIQFGENVVQTRCTVDSLGITLNPQLIRTESNTAKDLFTVPFACPEQCSGKLLVMNDEWPTVSVGFISGDAEQFLINVANWFLECSGKTSGRFHGYSIDWSVTEPEIGRTLTANGHTWTVGTGFDTSLSNLLRYDGIFLAGPVPSFNVAVFTEYIRQGGNIYIAAGTTTSSSRFGGASREANAWNPFLANFGLRYGSSLNGISLILNLSISHPLFHGVNRLVQASGLTISRTATATSSTRILYHYGGQGLFATYDDSSP